MHAVVRYVERNSSAFVSGGTSTVTVDASHENMRLGWVRYTLFATNVVIWLLGVGLLVAGSLLLVDEGVREIVLHFDIFDNYRVAGGFALFLGTCLFCTGFLGCCGALFLNGCLLLSYNAVMALFVVLEFTVMGLVWKHADTQQLDDYLSEAFRRLIVKSGNGIREVESFLDGVQSTMECCGGRGPDDYVLFEMDRTVGCLYYDAGIKAVAVYQKGCGRAVSHFLMGKSLGIGLVSLAILLVQLFSVGSAIYLYLDGRKPRAKVSSV